MILLPIVCDITFCEIKRYRDKVYNGRVIRSRLAVNSDKLHLHQINANTCNQFLLNFEMFIFRFGHFVSGEIRGLFLVH